MSHSAYQTSRRRFLQTSLFGAAATALPASSWGKTIGANSDARVAVIGIRGQGNGHIGRAIGAKQCRLTAICDPDSQVLAQRKAECEKKGVAVKDYSDYRKVLEDPNVDAVVIATPNHLHSLIAINAAQAGKHVYVEKPVSHNIWEGRKLVEAREKYGVVIHHGMQRRSDVGWREIIEWIKKEELGKMTCSRGLCYKPRKSIGKVDGPQKVPEHVDYNLWCGPREMAPLMRKELHYDWHWQWPYGNGDIGNQGPHQLDVARWVLGDPGHPTSVLSIGGRFGYDDDATTANTQIAFYDFKPVPLIFEVRGLPNKDMNWGGGMSAYKSGRIANIIEFEGGYVTEARAYDKDNKVIDSIKFPVTDGAGHFENWIAALHGAPEDPNFSAENGHLSAALAHLANISYRVGNDTAPGEIEERLKGDALALDTYERMAEHLALNGVDLEKSQPVLGAHLAFDPTSEKFTGELADEANQVAMETYREPFVIPEKV